MAKGRSWEDQGIKKTGVASFEKKVGYLDNNGNVVGVVKVKMKRTLGVKSDGTAKSISYPENEQERFKLNRALAKKNSVSIDSKGNYYVVSEKTRNQARGEVAKGKREAQMYNYNHK